MLKFFKRPLVITLVIFIIAAVLVYFYFFRKSAPLPETILAKRGTIVQEVSVTGQIKPAEEVSLAFEKGGKVAMVGASVGDRVNQGQIIARLESGELVGQLKEMEASVETEQAELDELKKGTRPEEIALYESKVTSAKVALDEAKKNLVDKLHDAYTKSDDAVRGKIDQFFDNPAGISPQLKFFTTDEIKIKNGRVSVESALNLWNSSLNQLTTVSDLDFYANEGNKNLNQVKSFLSDVALAVNNLTPSASLLQATIDSWRTDVSTARTNVYTATTNLTAAKEKFKTAETSLSVAENELVLEKAGSTAEQIASQVAQLKQAEAKVQTTQAQIAKNLLVSPINGIVTKQDAKVGEIVSANEAIVSIISSSDFSAQGAAPDIALRSQGGRGPASGWEIKANIPEADIAKIAVGDNATLTLDAYGEAVVFNAKVVKIDPAETVIEGVATYKTTLQFEKEDGRIKSGMTANVDIVAGRHENVIVIPQRAVVSKNGEQFVRVLEEETVKEYPVKTGLRGSDGNIEITEGLKEGQQVVTFIQGT